VVFMTVWPNHEMLREERYFSLRSFCKNNDIDEEPIVAPLPACIRMAVRYMRRRIPAVSGLAWLRVLCLPLPERLSLGA
jgi:hypothetical protein